MVLTNLESRSNLFKIFSLAPHLVPAIFLMMLSFFLPFASYLYLSFLYPKQKVLLSLIFYKRLELESQYTTLWTCLFSSHEPKGLINQSYFVRRRSCVVVRSSLTFHIFYISSESSGQILTKLGMLDP